MVEILGETGDYDFTYSEIDCKYMECYIRDYKSISEKNIEKQGTVIILCPDYSVGKDNIFYSINFEGEGYSKSEFREITEKIYSSIFIL